MCAEGTGGDLRKGEENGGAEERREGTFSSPRIHMYKVLGAPIVF